MANDTLLFQENRYLILRPIGESLECCVPLITAPFVAMLPAHESVDLSLAEDVVARLVDLGCIEFCCVGKRAEMLHDAIDWIVEDKNALGVVTTWHQDVPEACDYFVNTAGSTPKCLLALVAQDAEMTASLRRLVCDPETDVL
jgi:hypothetical protein